MTSYRERIEKLNPNARKSETSGEKQTSVDGELHEKLKSTFGVDLVERLTARMPGSGPKTMPFGYTSEKELRERISEVVRRPSKRLSDRQMKAVGIDLDPMLQETFQKSQTKELTPEERDQLGARWGDRRIAAVKKQGRLMSDQQLADWRVGRKLIPGDRARYIGPSRNEHTQADLLVPRETGQVGIIIHATDEREGRIITFHPMDAVLPVEAPGVDRQLVDLQVREHTIGWLTLERIPGPEERVA